MKMNLLDPGWTFVMRKKREKIILWIRYPKCRSLMLDVCVLSAMAAVIYTEIRSDRTWSYWALPLSGKIILLAHGHGGEDGGDVSQSGLVAKEVSLAISLILRDYLQEAADI